MVFLNLGAKIENDYELRMTDDELAATQAETMTNYYSLFTIHYLLNGE
jgi:hypothetical protein